MELLSNKYLHWSYTWQSSQRKLQKDDEPSQPLKRMNLDVLTSTQKVDDPPILDNGDDRAPSTLEPEWTWKKILIDKKNSNKYFLFYYFIWRELKYKNKRRKTRKIENLVRRETLNPPF